MHDTASYRVRGVDGSCAKHLTVESYTQWCTAKNGGGYTQRGVAKGLKVPRLFMITEVSITVKKTRRLVYAIYPRIPPNTPLLIRSFMLVTVILIIISFHHPLTLLFQA